VPDLEYTQHENTFLHSLKAKPQVGEIESGWNWKVIKGGESRRWGERWYRVTFTLDFFGLGFPYLGEKIWAYILSQPIFLQLCNCDLT